MQLDGYLRWLALLFVSSCCLTLLPFTYRSWGKRRLIITKEFIAFAFVDQTDQIDCIPFAEIEFVRKWQDETVAGVSTLLDADAAKDQHQTLTALHIATAADGYNSGRPYYLSAESVADRDWLMGVLLRNARAARKRVEAHTFFQRAQLAVRRRYEWKTVQYFFAGLTVAVMRGIRFPSSQSRAVSPPRRRIRGLARRQAAAETETGAHERFADKLGRRGLTLSRALRRGPTPSSEGRAGGRAEKGARADRRRRRARARARCKGAELWVHGV